MSLAATGGECLKPAAGNPEPSPRQELGFRVFLFRDALFAVAICKTVLLWPENGVQMVPVIDRRLTSSVRCCEKKKSSDNKRILLHRRCNERNALGMIDKINGKNASVFIFSLRSKVCGRIYQL